MVGEFLWVIGIIIRLNIELFLQWPRIRFFNFLNDQKEQFLQSQKFSKMASKTIKIWPIPENSTEQDIKNALGDNTVTRILIKKSEAYVELESEDTVDVLEFSFPDNKLYAIDATFQRVNQDFSWDSLSSGSSEPQELKDDHEHFLKNEEHIVDLTEPAVPNLITISNCDVTILSGLTEKDLKTTVFSQFSSVNRILKRGNKVIVQFQDQAETEKIEAVFPNLKIPALGSSAEVDLDAEDVAAFSTQWIQQHNKQTELASSKKQEEKHVLHQQIIPKFEKMTSMEANFLSSQQSSGTKVDTRFQDITEHSDEHIHTKVEISSDNQGFILNEEPERQEIFISGILNEEEEEKKRLEQQQALRKKQQEQERQRHQRQLELRQQKERQEKERLDRERHEREQQQKLRQQRQRNQRERQERERQQRERVEKERLEKQRLQKERQQRERAQKERIQKETAQKQRLENERLERERLQKQKAEKQRVQRENQQKRKKQQEEKARQALEKAEIQKKQLEQHLRIEREKQQEERRKRKQLQQEKIKLEQAERKRAEEESRKSQQFIISENKQNPIENEGVLINNQGSETLDNIIKSESRTPLLFWTAVLVTLFALLLI